MEGLAQLNLIVTDLQRAKEFWALLGWQSTLRHPKAAVLTFPNGTNLVLHEPEFAKRWDTFFGARYAIVCDPDGHRIGLKSPQDPERSYPLDN